MQLCVRAEGRSPVQNGGERAGAKEREGKQKLKGAMVQREQAYASPSSSESSFPRRFFEVVFFAAGLLGDESSAGRGVWDLVRDRVRERWRPEWREPSSSEEASPPPASASSSSSTSELKSDMAVAGFGLQLLCRCFQVDENWNG